MVQSSRDSEALALQWAATYESYGQHADKAVAAQMSGELEESKTEQRASWNQWASYYQQQGQLCKTWHVPTPHEQVTFYQSSGQEVPAEVQAMVADAPAAAVCTDVEGRQEAMAAIEAALAAADGPSTKTPKARDDCMAVGLWINSVPNIQPFIAISAYA